MQDIFGELNLKIKMKLRYTKILIKIYLLNYKQLY